jgi:hypothetical protein
MTRADILIQAKEIVCNDREGQYGKPEDNFAIIADLWTAYTGADITSEDVAIMMALLKIARIKTGMHYKPDSWIDAVGYMACGSEVAYNTELELERLVAQDMSRTTTRNGTVKFSEPMQKDFEVVLDEEGRMCGLRNLNTGAVTYFETVGGAR